MDHVDEFLARVRRYLDETGETERSLSMRAIGKPDLLRDPRRKHSLPKRERIEALAAAMGVTSDYLIGTTVDATKRPNEATVSDRAFNFRHAVAGQDLPIYGTALGHDMKFGEDGALLIEQTLLELTEPIRFIHRPSKLAREKTAYAVYIEGDSMSPRYEPGELAVVDPRRPPAPGDDVIVQLIGDEEQAGDATAVACALIKRLVRRSASYVELLQFNPRVTFRVPAEHVVSIHRIIPMGDLLGA